MRTSRRSLAGTTILLLAGSAPGCAGPVPQADWDIETVYLPAVYVTGETSDGSDGDARAFWFEWDASDPRLSGSVTVRYYRETFPRGWEGTAGAPPKVDVVAMTYEVVNDEGRWVGPATGLDLTEPEDVVLDTVVLSGEGAYDGLTAYLLVGRDPESGDPTFRGILFPGSMPPFPSLPAE